MQDEHDQKAFDETQAELTEIGAAPSEPAPEEPSEPNAPEAEPTEPVKEPEEKPEPEAPAEEPKDPQQVSPERPNRYKAYKEKLKAELQSDYDRKLADAIAEMEKKDPDQAILDGLEDDIKALADELEFDPAKTRKLIEVARKGMKVELSPEDRAILEEAKASKTRLDEEREAREQQEIFEDEWQAEALPSIKQQFPNATDQQLTDAKKAVDDLSHSEKYHDKDMDYILFKEKEALSKILFSPRQKTFESARPGAAPSEDEGEWPEFKPGMTPAEFDRMQSRREKQMETMGGEKVRITTTNDRGEVVEREE